jgi:drug/metabolite transporter (DMT)-like permease
MKKYKAFNLAMVAYLSVCLFWGSTYLAIRIGVQYMAPTILAGFRFLIAGSIMLGYAYFKKEKFFKTSKDLKNSIIVGFFLLVGGNGLVVWAEQFVHSGIASVIVAAIPLFMAIL